MKNRNIEKSLKCGWAKDVLTTPRAHTPHFFGYSTNISTQTAAHPQAFLWPITDAPEPSDCTGNIHLGQEELQPKNTTCQSHLGCYITSLWGLLGGYSQTVPHHMEKGIGEWKERETFISHYMMIAAGSTWIFIQAASIQCKVEVIQGLIK